MTDKILEITVVTSVGVRVYTKGRDFDEVEATTTKEGKYLALLKNDCLVYLIHPYVPVVIEYVR